MKEEINEAVRRIQKGEVILYPTETVWGLGCDPKNAEAVGRLCEIKNREIGKPLIILLHDIGQLYDYVEKIPDVAWDIIEFSEKPLTVILPKGKNVAKAVLGDDGSIAVRLVKKGFIKNLLQKNNKGLISTSANISGEPTPRDYKDLSIQILNGVDYVVNCVADETAGLPSSIIKLGANGEYKLIRK